MLQKMPFCKNTKIIRKITQPSVKYIFGGNPNLLIKNFGGGDVKSCVMYLSSSS